MPDAGRPSAHEWRIVTDTVDVSVSTDDPTVVDVLDHLLGAWRVGRAAAATSGPDRTTVIDVDVDPATDPSSTGRLRLTVNGHVALAGTTPVHAVDRVLQEIDRASLDSDPERLHVHAAALARDDERVIIAGASGAGKTTVALALLERDWLLVSDEQVAFAAPPAREPPLVGSRAWRRPLRLRPSTAAMFSSLLDQRSAWRATGHAVELVGSEAFGPPPADERPASLVALVRYEAGTALAITPVPPATMTRWLLEHTFDGARDAHRSLLTVAAAVAGASCVEVRHGDARVAAAALEDLVASSPTDPVPWRALESERGAGSIGDPDLPRRGESDSVLIGDGAVVVAGDGRILTLDSTAAAVWAHLDGRATTAIADELGAPVGHVDAAVALFEEHRLLAAGGGAR